MAETANGVVRYLEKNKGGFWGFKIGNERYNTGSKSQPAFSDGDTVEFSFYLKDDKYATIKGDVKVLPKSSAPTAATGGNQVGGGARDGYWDKKAAREVAVIEPRITYLASFERAISLVSLAQALGAYPSLEKAKPAEKLGQIRSYVEAEAMNIMALSYSVAAPKAVAAESEGVATEATAANDDSWEE